MNDIWERIETYFKRAASLRQQARETERPAHRENLEQRANHLHRRALALREEHQEELA